MVQKSRRPGAVAAIGLVVSIFAAPAAAHGAEPPADAPSDIVLDGIVVVRHIDAFDGPIAGATITVLSYRDPAAPIQVATATTDASGVASLAGIARPAEGAGPVLLDVRSDRQASTVTASGCTEIASWFATVETIPAAAAVEVVLDNTAKSLEVACPEPEPAEPAEPPAVIQPTADPSAGSVLAATGRPQITPPSTDAASDAADVASRSPAVPGMIAILVLLAGAVLLAVRRRWISRRGS